MSDLKDITGQIFGKLVITSYNGSGEKGSTWRAICGCGNSIIISRRKLKKGKKSCGCLMSKPKYQNSLNKIKAANARNDNQNFVYVAKHTGSILDMLYKDIYKIGYTACVEDRIIGLRSSYYGNFELMFYAKSYMAIDLERTIHLIFKDNKVPMKSRSGNASREFFHIDNHMDIIRYFHEVGAEVFYD